MEVEAKFNFSLMFNFNEMVAFDFSDLDMQTEGRNDCVKIAEYECYHCYCDRCHPD